MPQSSLFSFVADRRFLAANMIIASSVALLLYFPKNGVVETLLLVFFAYLAIPIFFVRGVLRESLSRYGFSWGNRTGMVNGGLIVGALGLFSALVWGIVSIHVEKPILSVPEMIRTDYGAFLSFVAFSTVSNGLSCLFFQGFVLSVWKERFGWKSVLLVTALFSLFLFAKDGYEVNPIFFFLVPWSFLASGVSFLSGSAVIAFCFLFFSDILLTLFLISQI